jgi:hypothetical protein
MRRDRRRVQIIRVGVLMALAAGLFAVVAGPSSADVTAVKGSAFGVSIPELTIFGGVPTGVPFGPTPSVTLAADASNSPQTASLPSVSAVFGPASIFSSGPTTVRTEGTLGAGGSVTSTATIENVNTSQSEVFTATGLSSTCTASESSAPTGSTTVTGGNVILQDPDPDATGEAGEVVQAIPANPPANTAYEGVVANVNDNFRAIYNEQVLNTDGSLTVTAYHLELLGPTAIGDLYVGQVVCGVTGTGVGPTTTQPPGVTTTTPPGVTTTTTQPPAVTTTTSPGGTTTTTRASGTTTTTRAGATTTTVAVPAVTTVPPGQHGQGLVRTGSTPQSLIVLGFLALVLGALALIGLGGRIATASGASGPWAALVHRAGERRRRRRPWNRRRWS